MERTEFQQKMSELKEQSERRRYDALCKKYAVIPDFTNMSLRDEIGVRYDLDELEQLKQKFGAATDMPVDNVLAVKMNNQAARQVQFGDMMQTQTADGVFDVLSAKNNARALFNVLQGYKLLFPLNVNDKYKHSVISCLGAQGGLPSKVATAGLGVAKEIFDLAKKFPNSQEYGGYASIINDTFNDLLADGRGLIQGYADPIANCYNMMQNFYPINTK